MPGPKGRELRRTLKTHAIMGSKLRLTHYPPPDSARFKCRCRSCFFLTLVVGLQVVPEPASDRGQIRGVFLGPTVLAAPRERDVALDLLDSAPRSTMTCTLRSCHVDETTRGRCRSSRLLAGRRRSGEEALLSAAHELTHARAAAQYDVRYAVDFAEVDRLGTGQHAQPALGVGEAIEQARDLRGVEVLSVAERLAQIIEVVAARLAARTRQSHRHHRSPSASALICGRLLVASVGTAAPRFSAVDAVIRRQAIGDLLRAVGEDTQVDDECAEVVARHGGAQVRATKLHTQSVQFLVQGDRALFERVDLARREVAMS